MGAVRRKSTVRRPAFECPFGGSRAPFNAALSSYQLIRAASRQRSFGQGAVGELSDACAQDGDRLGRCGPAKATVDRLYGGSYFIEAAVSGGARFTTAADEQRESPGAVGSRLLRWRSDTAATLIARACSRVVAMATNLQPRPPAAVARALSHSRVNATARQARLSPLLSVCSGADAQILRPSEPGAP